MTNRQYLTTLSDNELARQLLSKVSEIIAEIECSPELEELDMIDLYEQKQEHLEKWLNEVMQQDGVNTQSEILDEFKCRYPQYTNQYKKE